MPRFDAALAALERTPLAILQAQGEKQVPPEEINEEPHTFFHVPNSNALLVDLPLTQGNWSWWECACSRSHGGSRDFPLLACADINPVHWQRHLTNPPAFPPSTCEEESMLKVRRVLFVGPDQDGFQPSTAHLPHLKKYLRHVEHANVDRLRNSLKEGVSALMIVAHGESEAAQPQGIIVATPPFPLLALSEALLEGAKARLLRFLVVFACDQRDAAAQLILELAERQALHPDFAAVLFWGKPRSERGGHFLVELLQGLHQRQTFLAAVQSARRVVADKSDNWEAARPLVVTYHPYANPLPSPEELAEEEYLYGLMRREGTSPQW